MSQKTRGMIEIHAQDAMYCDNGLLGLLFDCLVGSKVANVALRFLEFTKFDPRSGSLEVFACCLFENGLVGDGVGVFEELVESGSDPEETWNLWLNGAVRVGSSDVAWKLYGDMLRCGVEPDVEKVTCLILALCKEDKLSEGYDLFRQCLEDGNVPRNVAFVKLISGFYEQREYYGVSALLHAMIVNGRLPGIDIYHEFIHWLCRNNKAKVGYRIFNDLKERGGHVPNNVMYTTMIHGLCKIKWLTDARKLLREMIEKGMKPCEQTYTVLISGLFQAGDVDGAQELHKELLDKGYKYTTMSYNHMIIGLYGGFQPPPASYSRLIEKLCEAGELQEAKGLWEDMQDKGVLLSACTQNSIIKGLSGVENFEDANLTSSPE
ncbi:hypothetical protein POM88_015895 [Heracleum sosnowskyi]|uniref:Pentatricopeptide repeat-containing protein n=1 Tax=Heracleum sosnowskyi TaxID=360622 RepID=A0AAD8INQ6_9APIA|nr:hypothetical protein POM88_015895 [Heracleum sosnowskyi]